jgi:flavin-dependent dehydrogenase
MRSNFRCRVLIAGAGPAGLACGLYLLRQRPNLASQIMVLEKSQHPRAKVCGGGLIPRVVSALVELGLQLDVPRVEVIRGVARTEVGEVQIDSGEVLCTIIRRDEFDAWLARAAAAAGLEIVENCRVLAVENRPDGVCVTGERGTFEASVLIGADGSGSMVRRSVFGRRGETVGRALTADLPVAPETAVEFARRLYRFDFRCVSSGIKGYCWSFPCLIGSRPHLNVGIYDQSPRKPVDSGLDCSWGKAAMVDQLRAAFPDLALGGLEGDASRLKSFPIRWYDPVDRFVSGRTVLAGDAAGVDPLMGEGISCALEHGRLAGERIGRFLDGDGQALAEYDRALHRSAIGRKLRKLSFAARRFYGPRHRLYFRLAGLSRRAQEIGIDWYNGVAGFDELPVRSLVARWAAAVLFGTSVR